MSGTIYLENSELSVGETNGRVLVPVVRTGDLSRPVTIEYGITADSATAGLDFTSGFGTVTMAAGVSRALIEVSILDDNISEPTEAFAVSLINVDSGFLLAPRTARVSILDNETPVVDPPVPPLVSDYDVLQQNIVTGLVQPISIEFVDDGSGRMFIAEKGGRIKVADADSGQVLSTFVDISAKVNDIQDRGLMDIVLHPDFPNEPYVYAFYVVDPPQTAGLSGNAGPNGGGNRFAYLTRFEADPATGYQTAIPGSETILLGGAGRSLSDISGGGAVDSTSATNQRESGLDPVTGAYIDDYIKVDSRSHAGGALAFGPDGALYVSIGDGTSFNYADPRSVSVQNIDSLSGKILRIDPQTGDGLADNPFVQPGDDLSSNSSKVYQLGLRNPFSMAFDQNGQLFISDTGWNSYEEINTGGAGANFGWPFYEGGDAGVIQRTPGYSTLPQAAPFYAAVAGGSIEITAPYRGFAHDSNAPGFQVQSITAGDVVYSGNRYPDELRNDFFFADFSQGEIYVADTADRREVSFLFKTSGQAPVGFEQGPDGYVYYADIVNGRVGRFEIEKIGEGGLKAEYFNTPAGIANLAQVNFNATPIKTEQMGWVSENTTGGFYAGGPADNFAVRYTGKIDAETAGNYTFHLGSDDGARLFIDGQLVVDNDGLHSFQERSATVQLAAGPHDVTVLYFEAGGTAAVDLDWTPPGGLREQVVFRAEPEATGSTILVNAAGTTGAERIALQIDGATVATFDNVPQQGATYSYRLPSGAVTPEQVRIAFLNDVYDPANGIDRNVTITALSIDGTVYDPNDPAVFSTGTWREQDGVTPGFGRGGTLHTNGYLQFAEPGEPTGSVIEITARGSTGAEQMQLLIDGVAVATFDEVSSEGDVYAYRAATAVTADQVRVAFINDLFDPVAGTDRNLTVDRIAIDGRVFETEAPGVFSTGTWRDGEGLGQGFGRGDTLSANGYFQYAETTGEGSELQIFASGAEGVESMDLIVNGVVVASFDNVPVEGAVFTYRAGGPVTADQVRIAFTNDLYDPIAGIDRNLTVDRLVIDGTTYQTEDTSVFSTGVWREADGIAPGFGRGETLASGGYFQYGADAAAAQALADPEDDALVA